MDLAVPFVSVAIVISVAFGIFSQLTPAMWFSWHPVLMTLGMPGLMLLGRWSYVLDESWGLDKQARRVAHRALMGSAAIFSIMGYACVLIAHSTNGKKRYFGYDFVAKA